MPLTQKQTEELKQICLKHYGIRLSESEALELGTQLVSLYEALSRHHQYYHHNTHNHDCDLRKKVD